MKKDLKKILAGIGAAGLISTGGLPLTGNAAASGWGGNKSAGSAEVSKPASTSGWSGSKDSTVSAPAEKLQDQAKEAVDKAKQTAEDKVDEAKEAAQDSMDKVVPEKKSGHSGWSWFSRAGCAKRITMKKPVQ